MTVASGEAYLWPEPYPDLSPGDITDMSPGPETRYPAGEFMSLAFIAAVRSLPQMQRAVFVLRGVMGFPAAEAAGILCRARRSASTRTSAETGGRPGVFG
jgi:DNA-directed RNA polymerase specialized sigma24 family protein